MLLRSPSRITITVPWRRFGCKLLPTPRSFQRITWVSVWHKHDSEDEILPLVGSQEHVFPCLHRHTLPYPLGVPASQRNSTPQPGLHLLPAIWLKNSKTNNNPGNMAEITSSFFFFFFYTSFLKQLQVHVQCTKWKRQLSVLLCRVMGKFWTEGEQFPLLDSARVMGCSGPDTNSSIPPMSPLNSIGARRIVL